MLKLSVVTLLMINNIVSFYLFVCDFCLFVNTVHYVKYLNSYYFVGVWPVCYYYCYSNACCVQVQSSTRIDVP